MRAAFNRLSIYENRYTPKMRPLTEPVFPRHEQVELKGFFALALTTPVYLVSIICWFVLVWLTVLDVDGTPVRLPLIATLVTHTYPVTVLGAEAAGWLGFFMDRPRLTRLALCAPPLHALMIVLTLLANTSVVTA